MSPEDRETRIAALEESLPAAERARRREARVALDLRSAETALRDAGGSDEEVRALRESAVGPAAAARLAALDRSRAEWQARLESYREARAAIERDASLDPAARARAIEQLRADRFSVTERLRVEALDELPPP
jgi:lipase chaperone LimK